MSENDDNLFFDDEKMIRLLTTDIFENHKWKIDDDDPVLMMYTVAKRTMVEALKIQRKMLQETRQEIILTVQNIEDEQYNKASKIINDTIAASTSVIEKAIVKCSEVIDDKVKQINEMDSAREMRLNNSVNRAAKSSKSVAFVSNIVNVVLVLIMIVLLAWRG